MHSSPQNRTISIDDLFSAAFNQSKLFYQKESLLGWRPVNNQGAIAEFHRQQRPPEEETPLFNNSPDIIIHEASDSILIEVTLPEILEESLYLEISGDLLIIKAERIEDGLPIAGENSNRDRRMVHRYVKLPINAQPGSVQARFDANVLRVMVHKPWKGLVDG